MTKLICDKCGKEVDETIGVKVGEAWFDLCKICHKTFDRTFRPLRDELENKKLEFIKKGGILTR